MNSKAEVDDVSACKKNLRIEVPVEVVREEFTRAYAELSRHVRVPGFRPGRVPIGVVRKRFAKEAREDVIQHIVPRALGAALVERKLTPATDPKISDLRVSESDPLTYTATVEIFPEIQVKEYRNLPLKQPAAALTDEEVDGAMERLREQNAQLIPQENDTAKRGHHLSVIMSGQEVDSEGKTIRRLMDKHEATVELGGADLLDEFTSNLEGAAAGETRKFKVRYPEDYGNKELAGKEAEYELAVQAIYTKEIPALDDEFARSLGQDVETVAALRERLRTHLQERLEARLKDHLREAAIDHLVKEHAPEVPESLVEHQLRSRLRKIARAAAASGIPPNSDQLNWPALAEAERGRAVRDVQAALILDRIAEKEGIEISDVELQTEISAMAKTLRQPALELSARLTKEGSLDTIRGEMKNRKALQLVVENAQVEVESPES